MAKFRQNRAGIGVGFWVLIAGIRLMRTRIPSYRLHRSSGQAVVTLDGKDYYLGKHNSDESKAEYRRMTGLYVANGMSMPVPRACVTVNEVLVRYYEHASVYYQKGGSPTSRLRFVRAVCETMHRMFGPEDITTLGPSSILALREEWLRSGNTRTTINRKVQAVKQIIDFAVEHGLAPGSISHSARAVRGLARGRCNAPDRDPVRPVDPEALNATLARLGPRRAAMVRVQVLTGMRPGEICAMRPRDVDRSGSVWIYEPGTHKAEHHGRSRAIAIGPKAAEILGPWLDQCPPDRYALSASGRRPAGVDSYRRAIAKAARQAGVQTWTPNQLRHNFATLVRKRFGLDAAQLMLGHAHADVTQVYAEVDRSRASEIASEIG